MIASYLPRYTPDDKLLFDLEKSAANTQEQERKTAEAIAEFLQGKGIEAEVVETPAEGSLVEVQIEVQLTGQNIKVIIPRVRTYGTTGSAGGTYLEIKVLIDKSLDKQTKKALSAKTKVVKERSLRTIVLNGKITAVKWVGGGIAGILNNDFELSKTLVDFAVAGVYEEGIKIRAGKTSVDIECAQSYWLLAIERGFGDSLFGLFDRIAKHIRYYA
jgi:hypothetical protein